MTDINFATIKKIAAMAKLDIKDHEIKPLHEYLTNIVNLIDKIQEVDTTTIEAPTNPNISNLHLRPDIVTETLHSALESSIKKLAPQIEENLYLVPQILDHSGLMPTKKH